MKQINFLDIRFKFNFYRVSWNKLFNISGIVLVGNVLNAKNGFKV